MKLTRLDDYQSWLIEAAGRRIAVDPWLTAEYSLAPGHWLFGWRRPPPACGVTPLAHLDALVLTGPFGDHCDPATLAHVAREVPCFAQPAAARRLRSLGFTQVTALRDGVVVEVAAGVMLEPVAPGFPFTRSSTGFVLTAEGQRLALEPHLVDLERQATRLENLDVLLIPVQGVRLLGVPYAMSATRALCVVQRLAPRLVVPTGNDPQRGHGLLSRLFLSYRGSVEAFGALLAAGAPRTTWTPLGPGEVVALESAPH